VRSFRPDLIFHFAAQVDVRDATLNPAVDARSNVIGSINVLTAAAEHQVRRLVLASSGGAIYGSMVSVPTAETEPAKPISPYGLSKLAAEMYAQWFRESCGLDVLTLRFGNVYGTRQDPARGAVVARFCEQAIRGAEFEIFGTGEATRDYLYVADAVAATFEAAQREHPRYCVYNIGSGQETSVRQLASIIAKLTGRAAESLNLRILQARPGEVLRSCLDISRARDDGVVGTVTPLDIGIKATLDWLRMSRLLLGFVGLPLTLCWLPLARARANSTRGAGANSTVPAAGLEAGTSSWLAQPGRYSLNSYTVKKPMPSGTGMDRSARGRPG